MTLANPGQPIIGNFPFATGDDSLIQQLIERRMEYAPTTALLLVGLGVVIARLFPSRRQAENSGEVAIDWFKYPPAAGFVLLLIGMGLCLLLFSEFFYLRDNFFVRINTVFKLYYQAWILWSIAAAYAIYSLLIDLTLPLPNIGLRAIMGGIVAISILAGLIYTVAGIRHRAWVESGRHFASESRRLEPPADWVNASRHVYDGESVEAGTVVYARVNLADAAEADLLRAQFGGIAVFDGAATVIYAPLTLDGAAGLLPADDMKAIPMLQDIGRPRRGSRRRGRRQSLRYRLRPRGGGNRNPKRPRLGQP